MEYSTTYTCQNYTHNICHTYFKYFIMQFLFTFEIFALTVYNNMSKLLVA